MKRVALITGGTGGVGSALADALSASGYLVVIHCNRNKAKADEMATKLGGLFVVADVTREDSVKHMVEYAMKSGRIDVLVNAAAIYDASVIWKMPTQSFERVIDTNLKGAFLTMKHTIPIMREQGYGRILNLSSTAGEVGMFGTSAYSASKAGLVAMTRAAAKEVARFGITVNALVIGYADTGMYHRLSPEVRAQLLAEIPLGRLASLDDIAQTALFLTSPEAGYITGEAVRLTGGLS